MQFVDISLLLHSIHSPSQNATCIFHHAEHRRNFEREEPAQGLEILLPRQRRELSFPPTFKGETKMGKTEPLRSLSQCLQKSLKQPSKSSFLEMLAQPRGRDEPWPPIMQVETDILPVSCQIHQEFYPHSITGKFRLCSSPASRTRDIKKAK